jgi:hypothetical protein
MGLKPTTQQAIIDLIPAEPEVQTSTPAAADDDENSAAA